MKVGLTVDVAIPMGFAFAMGAVRVAAIRSGRISLAANESLPGKAAGGHTIERHIGKSTEELFARLERRASLPATSTFRNLNEAEKLISRVISDNRNQIQMWVKHIPRGMNAKMDLEGVFANQTGILVRRGYSEVIKCHKARVVLQFKHWHGKPYFVLTAFPKA
ncbi:RNase A-like domain-containing protein [Erwinia tracheiphila]|nr:RNase A-like domain-containing protein [Erwinia tracheiphila]